MSVFNLLICFSYSLSRFFFSICVFVSCFSSFFVCLCRLFSNSQLIKFYLLTEDHLVCYCFLLFLRCIKFSIETFLYCFCFFSFTICLFQSSLSIIESRFCFQCCIPICNTSVLQSFVQFLLSDSDKRFCRRRIRAGFFKRGSDILKCQFLCSSLDAADRLIKQCIDRLCRDRNLPGDLVKIISDVWDFVFYSRDSIFHLVQLCRV